MGQTEVNVADDLAGFADSPNGQCSIFSIVTWGGSNMVATTQLYVGGVGNAPLLVATLTRDNSVGNTFGGGYAVLRWDPSGVLLGADPTGVGGLGPFVMEGYSIETVVRLDPVTGSISAPLCNGPFGDLASDGALACITGEGSDAQIAVTGPETSSTTIDTHDQYAGGVGFRDGSSVLVNRTTSDAAEPCESAYCQDLWAVQLGGQTVAPRELRSADPPNFGAVLLSDDTAVDLVSESTGPELVLIDLTTDQVTPIVAAGRHPRGALIEVLPVQARRRPPALRAQDCRRSGSRRRRSTAPAGDGGRSRPSTARAPVGSPR